jgi:hypothetical protein
MPLPLVSFIHQKYKAGYRNKEFTIVRKHRRLRNCHHQPTWKYDGLHNQHMQRSLHRPHDICYHLALGDCFSVAFGFLALELWEVCFWELSLVLVFALKIHTGIKKERVVKEERTKKAQIRAGPIRMVLPQKFHRQEASEDVESEISEPTTMAAEIIGPTCVARIITNTNKTENAVPIFSRPVYLPSIFVSGP